MDRDNYNNEIKEKLIVVEGSAGYELVKDSLGGWYVNENVKGKRDIIAKFPYNSYDVGFSEGLAYLFWNALTGGVDENR